MTKYFTADLHFDHERIIKLCNRPFNDVEEMNQILIDNWNATVQPGDQIYVLGDVGYMRNAERVEEILSQLNGEKFLIIGNHDSNAIIESKQWVQVCHYKELKIDKKKVILFHYPIAEWNGYFRDSYHLYGHCHNGFPQGADKYALDVGVDVHDYKPISFDEVCEWMNNQTGKKYK